MDLQKEREAFEKWAFQASEGWASFVKSHGDNYENDKLQFAWKAWQAAKAQVVLGWFVAKEIKPVEKDSDEKVLTWDEVNGLRLVPVWSFKSATDATHWMPLPDAPQEQSHESK